MNKEELLKRAHPIIQKIAQTRRNNFFAYYEGDDIQQEVWVFCLEALERYNPVKASRGLSIDKQIEHFLNHHVANRLKNLMRDKYFRPETQISQKSGNSETRINLINALPLDICDTKNISRILGSGTDQTDPVSSLLAKETIEFIFARLPQELIDPFQSLLGGNKIRRLIEMQLQEEIARILQEIDNE